MKNKFLSAAVVILLVATTSFLFAGGYQVNEHGARAMGMGGAFVAQASDASAVFFNPAGLAFQSGINVLAGTTLIMPSTSFTGPTPLTTESKMVSQTFYPSNLYVSYQMENWTFAVGAYNPYGLGTEWETSWVGRYYAIKTDLKTYFINPTISYKVNDQFSFGVGVSYILATATLTRKIPPPVPGEPELKLDGDGNGVSFNVGAMYKPTGELSIGVAYRSLAKITLDGDATYGAPLSGSNGKGKVTLPMPANLVGGIAYNLSKDFTVEADFQYVFWDAYDKLEIELPTGTQTQAKDWKNTSIIRVGAEYRMDQLSLRAGFIYDSTPQPDAAVEPLLPDANRTEFTVGLGYQFSDAVRVDAAFQYIKSADRTASVAPTVGVSGLYKSTASLIGVNFGFNF